MMVRGSGHVTMFSVLVRTLLVLAGVQSTSITTSDSSSSLGTCTVKGRVFTQRRWYGFLVQKPFHRDFAKIQYQITYPVKECCANLLIYYDDQVKQLQSSMTCEDREHVLPQDNNQVIPLRASNDSSGCTLWNETGEAFYVCLGERIFRSSVPRTWFFAISRCDHEGPLNLNYVFNITGYYGECEEDPLAPSSGWNSYVAFLDNNQVSSSKEDMYWYLSISLGVLAGLAMILAAVFFVLWFMGLKQASKGKGSSVTSSQATMTQDDIFYVNPSLSDQGQADYSQSGSENYYEVIPERRSYESINTGLSNGGIQIRQLRSAHGPLGHHPHHHHLHHPHAHAHGHAHHPHALAHHVAATQPKDAAGFRAAGYPVFDYPPPPYQPPKNLGGGKHSTLNNAPGHSHTLSLPANQRQRPALVHHAYHSSLVPTSAALGHPGISSSNSASGLSSSGGGINSSNINPSVMSLNNSPANSSNIMISSSNGGLVLNNTSGMGVPASAPNSLCTFVGGASNLSTIPGCSGGGGGINLTALSNHQLLGGSSLPHSSANSNAPSSSSGSAVPSLAAMLNSASLHASVPVSGQSETSA